MKYYGRLSVAALLAIAPLYGFCPGKGGTYKIRRYGSVDNP